MNTARYDDTATLLNKGMLITGGYDSAGPLSSAELYHPVTRRGIYELDEEASDLDREL